MEQKDYTDVEVNLKELLASILRGGKTIIVITLIFAVLFGAAGVVNRYAMGAAFENAYKAELAEYEAEKAVLTSALEKAQKDADNQREYNEKSCLMQIDPYNKVTTTIIFSIFGVNLNGVTDSFDITEIPISYMTSRIQAQYLALWNSLNLEKIVAGTQFSGVGDKYLREVILLTAAEGGVLTLTVDGTDTQTCEQAAQAVYAAIQQSTEAVVKGSYHHQLTMLNDIVTKTSIDWELEEIQQEQKTRLEEQEEKEADCEKQLAQLRMPTYDGGFKGVVVDAVLGGVIGLVLAIIWLVIRSFIKGSISGSKQLIGRYNLLHFGSLLQKRGFWDMLGYRVMGEKLWKNAEQAGSYIRENSQSHLPEGNTLVVATTLPQVDEKLQNELIALLAVKGQKVTFVTDAAQCPEALAAMTQCDGIVLAERAFVSQTAAVKDVLNTAAALHKPVCGFVLL